MAKRTKKRPRGIIEPPKPVAAKEPAVPARSRKWLKLLLPLSALVVLLVLGISWVASTLGHYRSQQRVADKLKALGATTVEEDAGVAWLEPIAGGVPLKDVVRVDFRKAKIEDRDLDHIGELTKLRDLLLERQPIGDSGMARLAKLQNLENLDLTGTYISDEGIRSLGNMKKLQWLSLNQTPITDAGVIYLRALPNLQVVEVGSVKVTDKGVGELRRALPDTQVYR